MKITDDEREAAYELKWLVQEVLAEHQRARLYVEVYAGCLQRGVDSVLAATRARIAIIDMANAFNECPTCAETSINESQSQQKAN
jgi:hypothetical protein